MISPGSAFIADGIQLRGPLSAEIATAPTTPAQVTQWTADRREISVIRSPIARVVVVPESVNPGWVARTPDGATLTPVIVNGWQQGWVVPAGATGTITLGFASNGPYRVGLVGGLALLPLLVLLALVPPRRPEAAEPAAAPWSPGALAGVGRLACTWVLPPTLTLQYHFAPEGKIHPYVGAGVNWTMFYNEKASTQLVNAIGATNVNLSNSFSFALQAGVDFDITEKMFINIDAKYVDMDTNARLTTGALVNNLRADINPLIIGVGVGWRF